MHHIIFEGSLEVKLPTIWTDGQAEAGRVREEKRREEERRSMRRERGKRQKMQVREKVAKSRNTVFFPWFVAPPGRKVGLLKRRVQSHLARWEMKNCTSLWHEENFEVKMHKTHQLRSTFGSWDVEKAHAFVARSTCGSQNAQSTPCSEHFSKLRCRQSARHCGAKQISKSKCTKHIRFEALLEVEMSKKCTPLWREAHFQVKSVKNWRSRTTFGRSDAFLRGRRKGLWTLPKVSKMWGFCSFNYNHHYITLRDATTTSTCTTTLHYTTLITLHYTQLHYTTLTTTTTTLHYTTTTTTTTTLHYTTLH